MLRQNCQLHRFCILHYAVLCVGFARRFARHFCVLLLLVVLCAVFGLKFLSYRNVRLIATFGACRNFRSLPQLSGLAATFGACRNFRSLTQLSKLGATSGLADAVLMQSCPPLPNFTRLLTAKKFIAAICGNRIKHTFKSAADCKTLQSAALY